MGLAPALAGCSSDDAAQPAASTGGDGGAGDAGGGGAGGAGGAAMPVGAWTADARASRDGDTGFEPAIAASADGKVYVPYCDQAHGAPQVVIAVSSDGGKTFTHPFVHHTVGGMSCDVTAAVAPDGTAYVAWISYRFGATTVTSSDVLLTVSHDGGQSFGDPVVVSNGDVDPPMFNDRPWITVGPDGVVHATFSHIPASEFAKPDNNRVEQYYAQSSDGGATWSQPLQVTPISPAGHMILGSFGISLVADDVLVPYVDIQLAGYRLLDVGTMRLSPGAAEFSTQSVVAPSEKNPSKGFPGVGGIAQASCFVLAGPDPDASGLAVQVLHSTDGAKTFGAPVTVAGNQHGFLQPGAASDDEGRCMLVWLDDRSGAEELYSAIVDPDGSIHEAVQVNDVPLQLGTEQTEHSGDYLDASIAGGSAYTAWADLRSGIPEVYVASARVK